jgi:hypothetical protein
LVVLAWALPLTACDAVGDLLFGPNYEGPPPAAEGISNEVAIVRNIHMVTGGAVLLLDRVRYLDTGDPHNVNRVVRVSTGTAGPEAVAVLNLERGDRVVVSTQYRGTVNVAELASIPDWPGHRAHVYPIGFHFITVIARTPG